MGHYASEMEEHWGDSIDCSHVRLRVKKKLKSTPLSEFKASDAFDLANLFSVIDFDRVPKETLERFEKIADRFKVRKP